MGEPMPEDLKAAFVARLLDETRQELIRAEGKTSLLLAALIAGGGAVLGGITARAATPLEHPWPVRVTAFCALAAVLAGAVRLASAVWPRLGRSPGGAVDYFGDVASLSDVTSVAQRLDIDKAEIVDRDTRQLWALSRIVMARYRAIRTSMQLIGLGIAFGTCSLLIIAFL